uniref:NADH-ubiquinone oxidoreductase chain 4L n=1 Tax=Siren intermedia texana TaxID=1303107 RepID=A0A343A0H5_SIRIN|nr:NADH dehydrogenase subunit 4L [Siren intermedia texana]
MPMMTFILTMSFMFPIMGLAMHRIHLLSALLCLEGMMLALFLSLSLWANQLENMLFFSIPMFMLTFSACEAGAGLALMVSATRTHGSDHLKNLNLLQC